MKLTLEDVAVLRDCVPMFARALALDAKNYEPNREQLLALCDAADLALRLEAMLKSTQPLQRYLVLEDALEQARREAEAARAR